MQDASVDATSTKAAPSAVLIPSSLEVDYLTKDLNASSQNQIQFNLFVTNRGAAAINLSDVTLRYWFTNESNPLSSLFFISYYSQNSVMYADITHSVNGVFAEASGANVTSTADTYLELSFLPAAGALPNGQAATIQVAIHGPGSNGYSDLFDETNDYSFDVTKTAFEPWPNVTAYVTGQLVWGAEPGANAGGGAPDATVGEGGAAQDDAEPGPVSEVVEAGSEATAETSSEASADDDMAESADE